MFRNMYVFLLVFPFFMISIYGNISVVKMGILVYVCLSIWILLFLKKRLRKSAFFLPEIFLVMYAAWGLLSTVMSDHPYVSLFGTIRRHEGLLALYSYFTIFFIAFRFAPIEKYKGWLTGLVSVSVISGFYGLLQKFPFLPFIEGRIRIQSFFGNPNFYGSYLVIMLILAIVLTLLAKKRKNMTLFWIAAMFLFLNILYTWTRSALVGIFIGLVFFTVFLWLKLPHLRKRYAGILLSLFLVFGVVNLLESSTYMQRISSIFESAGQVLQDNGNAGSYRWKIWEIAFPLVGKQPVFGSGPDTVAYVFDQDAFCKFIHRPGCRVDKAHNEYLQIAITMGIPALIFYLLFLSTILWKMWKAVWKSCGEKQMLLAGFFTLIIAYAVQAVFNISAVPAAPYFWLMLGMGYRLAMDVT